VTGIALNEMRGCWYTYESSRWGTIRHWGISSLILAEEMSTVRHQSRNRIEDEAIRYGLKSLDSVANGDDQQAAEMARIATGWAMMAANMTEMYKGKGLI